MFRDLGLGRLEKSNLHSRFLLASFGAISFQVWERQNSSHQKSTFSGVPLDGIIFISVWSQFSYISVWSVRVGKRIDFASTLQVRGLPTEARIPHVRYSVYHIFSRPFWTIHLLSYLWLAGLLLYHKLLSLEGADWVENSAKAHSWAGTRTV
jgi:hypothetical protein